MITDQKRINDLRQYKLILLFFLIVFTLSAIFRNFVTNSDLSTLIGMYTFALLYWLLLFFFLLYARNGGIAEGNWKLAPAKLLPIVVAWIILISLVYPITMVAIYKTVNAVAYRKIGIDDNLVRFEKASIDTSKSAEQRLKAAEYYYKYSGKSTVYIDDNDRSKKY